MRKMYESTLTFCVMWSKLIPSSAKKKRKERKNELIVPTFHMPYIVPIKELLRGIPGNPINLKELCIVKAYKFGEIGNKWSIRLGHANLITVLY